MPSEPRYDVDVTEAAPLEGTLLVGLSTFGLAGLTALDHLVDRREFVQVGHVRSRGLPTVTPFADGTPRHPIRLYASRSGDCCVLLGETVVPVGAASAFVDAVLDATSSRAIDEVAVLHGVPIPHGPDEHEVFAVSTAPFRERRLVGTDVEPLAGGVLDGVPGEFAARSLAGETPPLGVLVTPVHPPGPDLEAAMRYLEVLRAAYDLDVDDERLRERAAAMRRYYDDLANRMESLESQAPGRGDLPEDRAYM